MANLSNINNKFLVTTGGNVLIGQTSAVGTAKLQVTGEVRVYTGSNLGYWGVDSGNSYVYLGTNSSGYGLSFQTGGTERIRIDSAGRIGIQVTPSTWALDFSVIQMSLVGASLWSSSYATNLGANIYQDTASTYKQSGASYGTSIHTQFDGVHRFYGNTSQGANTSFVPTERMRIASDGNVGIDATPETGMVSYIKQLRIGEQSGFQGHAEGVGQDSATWVTTNYKFGTSGAVFINGTVATPGYANIYQQQLGDHSFSCSTTTGVAGGAITVKEQMVLKQNGNVGIGTTSPSQKLEINPNDGGDTRNIKTFFNTASVYNPAAAGTEEKVVSGLKFGWYSDYYQIGATRGGGTDVADFIISDTGQERLIIKANGDVGIGTTSPERILHLDADQGRPIIQLDKGGDKIISMGTGSSATGADDTIFQMFNEGSELVRIFTEGNSWINGGNVGIGTNSPSQKLEVTGNFKLNGTTVQEGTGNNLTFKYRTANSNAYTGGNATCKFGRFYWTPAHWVTGAPVIKVTLHCKYYQGERREYIIKAGYNDTNPIINELQPSSTLQRITLVLGAKTAAGYNYAGQPVYYVDLQWVQTSYIWGWAQIESQVGFLTSNPTSTWGGVVMDSGITQTNGGLIANSNSFFAGNVGVGTETPPAKLSVYAGGADGIQLLDLSDTNNSGRVFYARSGGGSWCIMNNATNYSIRSGGVPGSTSGTEKIRLSGYSATSWTSGSDETIKENIKPIGNVLDKINDYRCIEYNLIDDETKDKKIGFIAQDWQEDFPQIIEQMEDEKIGMKYTETIPILLKAIQELKAEIDELKK